MVSNPDAAKKASYDFKVLDKGSITKSVSLSSNFDADYVLMKLQKQM